MMWRRRPLREAQRALDDTRLVAPFDGRVARTLVNNFQNVQANQPVLVFQSTSILEVDIQVPEADMSAAERGITARNARDLLEARAEFPTIPNRQFDLELKSFSTEATPSARTFRVTFNLYPPEGQNILPGMTCTVLLRPKSRLSAQPAEEGIFQVPVRAVSTAGGKSSLWRLDPAIDEGQPRGGRNARCDRRFDEGARRRSRPERRNCHHRRPLLVGGDEGAADASEQPLTWPSMNIAEASIRNKTVTLVFAVLMVVLGIWSYIHLPRLEDPEFTIKDALIITPYPGASAQEVEKEVSDVIELAAQQLEQLDRVVSRSERGRSTVTVTIRDQYDRHSLPQVWDELRRKVADAQRRLPPGAGPSLVLDDFGDVFGIFFALTGPDFSDAQLYDTAKLLRRELLLVPDVKKIEIFGHQQEVIYIELARDRMAQLGIRPETIFAALREQNLVVPSGAVDVGPLAITINPTGEWTGVEDFENLLIRGAGDARRTRLSERHRDRPPRLH